jgi:hypothetical protein
VVEEHGEIGPGHFHAAKQAAIAAPQGDRIVGMALAEGGDLRRESAEEGADRLHQSGEEWEAITGARVTRSAWKKVSSETWDTSTIMPRRFISTTTDSPKPVRPACSGGGDSFVPEESAQVVLKEWVRVM